MRQVLLNSGGAIVARVPRPTAEPGSVLVRVHYSLISVGTEIAPLRSTLTATDITTVEKGRAYAAVARHYLKASLKDPRKAAARLRQIGRRQIAKMRPVRAATPAPPPDTAPVLNLSTLAWTLGTPQATLRTSSGGIELITDDTPAGYQILSQAIAVPPQKVVLLQVKGRVHDGAISIGFLSQGGARWLMNRTYDAGPFDDLLVCDPDNSPDVTMVITTANAGTRSRVTFDRMDVSHADPLVGGLPLSELNDQGWNVGYSVAGEVIAVGEGVTDLGAGDLVACSGAGQANHADYVNVKRNLVCRIPKGCGLNAAASATVGAIALQGVRRAAPQLGDRIAVVGLGLIGQITVQLLKASGCVVLGLDLDPGRVTRALQLGLDAGTSDPEQFKAIVRDHTAGQGADRTILTAATRSDSVINLSMDTTRRRGAVVIVGDVSLNVQREVFYRKEIDLLMSTSYGPGRYDIAYEIEGHDYPYAYVRWTLNRNMQAYLEAIATGKVNFDALVDRVIAVDDAPAAYKELAKGGQALPMGILIRYPDDTRALPDPADAPRVTLRGHRRGPEGVINYALVGAGSFGTAMLVPQMRKLKDRFFLKGVVSRGSSQSNNFARENQVELFTTDYDAILRDDSFSLVVISTRHDLHADQVVRGLSAGKHVFVEKPLAITWEGLQEVERVYRELSTPPLLMVGFNRRFSPAVQLVREHTTRRRAPLVMNYRLNAGYLPPDHWVHGPQGGGRNIGEACHMYDVFRSLSGAPVRSVSATPIDPGRLPYFRNDNFVATIGYEDGSVGTLTYTSLGPKSGLGKEYCEIFCDGEVYILDDYRKLLRASDGAVLWQSGEADKGHFNELAALGEAIAGNGAAPIPFDELIETTALSLEIEDLLFGRMDSAALNED